MIKNFTPRLYQETILSTAAMHNTLVVLPTGLGKTNIFLMLAAQRLRQHPDSKVLFIGPTRPLIDQYRRVFEEHFEIDRDQMAVFTGMVAPAKRKTLWTESKIIFSTPQGLENDIINKNIDLSEVSLLGVDEAHRAVGEYSYVWVAKRYLRSAKYPRILGLTASPGSDVEKIMEVCKNLGIEKVEVRSDLDYDVKPYIKDIDIEWITVDLPPHFLEVQKLLQMCIRSKFDELKKYGFVRSQLPNKVELLKLQGSLHGSLARGEKDFPVLKSISLISEIIKAQHALELLESQGITTLHFYFERIFADARTTRVKAVKNLVADVNFKSAWIKTTALYEKNVEHPKLGRVMSMVSKLCENPDMKIMVFTEFRDSAVKIRDELSNLPGVIPELFVGQTKRGETGMTQKQQKALVERFRDGECNVLVATSIGEEGLDIPQVDMVMFYEPVPSAIRQIQRRGRTGRQEKGRVVILMARNTRDEAYRWVAHHKEKKMHRILGDLKSKLRLERQESLQEFKPVSTIKIFADMREKSSGVIKELVDQNVNVEMRTLSVGDYLCSSRVGAEVKNIPDFVNSIVDGRLLQQLKALKLHFEKPVVILEGDEDIYSVRNVHANAIRGMLATIAVDYAIPIITTKTSKETAAILIAMAKREQLESKKDFAMHEKKPMSQHERQEFIVSSLPGIESTMARKLLKELGSVQKVMDASIEDLKKVPLIGDKKAEAIRKIIEKEYVDREL